MKRNRIITLILAAAFSALLFTSPVEAGNKHRRHDKPYKHQGQYKPYKHHNKVQMHRGHRAAPPIFHAPARMHQRHRNDYRSFFAGDTYFRPHRHYHAVYVFPIRTRHGVVYREFEYCRGDMFVRNQFSYRGRNVSFNIGF
jgi:hypothetical protein